MPKGKVMIDEERCKGCEVCVAFCPKEVLEMSLSLNSMGYHPVIQKDSQECTGCGFCYLVCPDAAIEVFKLV